jgi:hypothetical protein
LLSQLHRFLSLKSPSIASTQTYHTDVQDIFTHWQAVMRHPQAKLDQKRAIKIAQALKLGYTTEQLKQAVNGCAASSFNMGENDRKQRYDGIGLIFRDAEHIERFMGATNKTAGRVSPNTNNNIFAGAI